MNIPCVDWKTLKKYEEEIDEATEFIAKKFCEETASLERKLTIENAQSIEESL